jgi:hypothetical protein
MGYFSFAEYLITFSRYISLHAVEKGLSTLKPVLALTSKILEISCSVANFNARSYVIAGFS